MSTELGLDPSDPLNLLLHNSSDQSNDADSTHAQDAQAWSSLSALWSDSTSAESGSVKSYADMMPMDFADLSSSMPMDMDFNHPMAIEPSALHYDTMKFSHGLGMGFGGYDDQYGLSGDMLATQFPFTFQFNNGEVTSSGSSSSSVADSPQSFTKERRLSVTSSSSSSGASLSPVPESLPSPATGGYVSDTQPKEEPIPTTEIPSNPYANDPVAELAARVRQAAGVMLAVPMGAQLQSYGAQMLPNQAKLPIPRLPRHNSTPSQSTPSSSSSAASTPPPSTPPPSTAQVNTNAGPLKLSLNAQQPSMPSSADFTPQYTPVAPTPTTALARPKTSHTTIERRYRTNLNARIQSLRMAVPALRVLEDRDGGNGKKIKKNLKGNVIVKGSSAEPAPTESEDGTPVDVIDERGFVDGVKVARKCSKANVLGKAVEYIRVLKKREMRLKREQEGLKKLIEGLVGGAALVKEWEREWREMFGGEEKDEVEGEVDGDTGEYEGEDGEEDGEDDDDDDEDERKRKKVKLSSTASKKAAERKKANAAPAVADLFPPVVAAAGPAVQPATDAATGANPVPEKRKRGRPRKVVPPPAALPTVPAPPASASDAMVQDEPAAIDPAQQQWLQAQQGQAPGQQPQQYLLAVFALFSFFNSPLTSSSSSYAGSFFSSSPPAHPHTHTGTVLSAQPPLAYAPEIVAQFSPPPSANANIAGWNWQGYLQTFHLLVSVLVLLGLVASWLGVDVQRHLGGGAFAAGKSAARRGRSLSVRAFRARKEVQEKERKERKESGPRGWIGVGEESVLEGRSSALSLYDRVQIYRACTASPSPSTLTTLSLVLHTTTGPTSLLSSLAKMRAQSVWDDAKRAACDPLPSSKASASVAYALVFEEVKGVEDALAILARARAEIEVGVKQEQSEEELKASTPLDVLARIVIKQRVKRHLGKLFVRAVSSSPSVSPLEEDDLISFGSDNTQGPEAEAKQIEAEEALWRRTIDAARELGGHVEELGRTFERVWKAPSGTDEEEVEEILEVQGNEHESPVGVDGEIQALLVALVLYRRLFSSHPQEQQHLATQEEEEGCVTPTALAMSISGSTLLSPPPSPRLTPRAKHRKSLHNQHSGSEEDAYDEQEEEDNEEEDEQARLAAAQHKRMLFVLRTALGSRVFEQGDVSGHGEEAAGGDEQREMLEDAKDRVVDLIVDVERREKRAGVV